MAAKPDPVCEELQSIGVKRADWHNISQEMGSSGPSTTPNPVDWAGREKVIIPAVADATDEAASM